MIYAGSKLTIKLQKTGHQKNQSYLGLFCIFTDTVIPDEEKVFNPINGTVEPVYNVHIWINCPDRKHRKGPYAV